MSTTEIAPSGLADLATRIRNAHSKVVGAFRNTVREAIAAGKLLIQAKDRMPYGDWEPWLKDQCGVAERTARLYMQLARGEAKIEDWMAQAGTGSVTVTDLTLTKARALLIRTKEKPQPSATGVVENAATNLISALNDLKKTSDTAAKHEATKIVERLQKAEFWTPSAK
jgi:hypothetical protein